MTSHHKPQTSKQYQERINRVWLFIQSNLDSKLQLEDLAAIALLSPFHFHRIFTAMTGESVTQYIRRLRLERAANRVIYTDQDITTIGLDNGYETPAAFSRAFKQQFGVSPSMYRKTNNLKTIIQTKDSIEVPEQPLEYSIIHFKPQKVLFVRKTGYYTESAIEAWQTLLPYVSSKGIDIEGSRQFGIPLDSPEITAHEKIRYDACITVDDTIKPDGEFGVQTIRGGRYAVFTHNGPYEKLEHTYNQIILNWLPNTNYQLMDSPAVENYLNSECLESAPENLKTDIYIHIQ